MTFVTRYSYNLEMLGVLNSTFFLISKNIGVAIAPQTRQLPTTLTYAVTGIEKRGGIFREMEETKKGVLNFNVKQVTLQINTHSYIQLTYIYLLHMLNQPHFSELSNSRCVILIPII